MILQPIAFIVVVIVRGKLKPTITLYMLQYIRKNIKVQQMLFNECTNIGVLYVSQFLQSCSIHTEKLIKTVNAYRFSLVWSFH